MHIRRFFTKIWIISDITGMLHCNRGFWWRCIGSVNFWAYLLFTITDHRYWSTLVQVMVRCFSSTSPLFEPILTNELHWAYNFQFQQSKHFHTKYVTLLSHINFICEIAHAYQHMPAYFHYITQNHAYLPTHTRTWVPMMAQWPPLMRGHPFWEATFTQHLGWLLVRGFTV